MKNSFGITFIIAIITVSGCTHNHKNDSENQELVIIDLTEDVDNTKLNLNDTFGNFRMVRLETSNNCLINHFNGFVGDKYIVAFEQDKIIQFTANGNFIGIVANKGKGPDEFSWIDAWEVSENEEFLYYHDPVKKYIKKYNLDKNNFEKDITCSELGHLESIQVLNDTVLTIFPNRFTNSGYHFFFLSMDGKITRSQEVEDMEKYRTGWRGRSSKFMRSPGGDVFFVSSVSDTVYRVKDSIMVPCYILNVGAPQKNGDGLKGVNGIPKYISNKKLIITKVEYESSFTPTRSSLSVSDNGMFIYDVDERKLHGIGPINMNISGVPFEIYTMKYQNNHKIVVDFTAINLKMKIEDKLEEDISEQDKKKLEKLNSEISEYDNPVLFVVDIKDPY